MGGGWIVTPENFESLPSKVTSFCVQSFVITSRASLEREARCLIGTPQASNSLGESPPIPTPRGKRPFETTARIEVIFANTMGLYRGSSTMLLMSLILPVTPAAAERLI